MSMPHNKKCFTIMPYTVRDVDLLRYAKDKNHWNEVYRGLIVPAVMEAGLQCERDDEDWSSRLITENIWGKIEEANVILCDLSAHNPNVYLELGWALRADKRFVLIKDDITIFNFDLNQFYTYEYSHRLQPCSVRQSVKELADVIQATLKDNNRYYSMTKKLSLQLQAMKATSEGNIEVTLLKELISEVRSSTGLTRTVPQAWSKPSIYFPEISTQEELGRLLIGSTWRKRNNVEQIIFNKDRQFYSNHAGHPSWRENRYELGSRLGEMTLV